MKNEPNIIETSTTIEIPEPFFEPTEREIKFQENIAKARALASEDEVVLAPLPGPQTRFCLMGQKEQCDIILLLGSAGSAKSFAGLLKLAELATKKTDEPIRMVAFRKTASDIRKADSLLDSANKIFPHVGGHWNDTKMRFTFGEGVMANTVNLSHLQHEKDIESHLSAQYFAAFFDEIVQFSRKQVMGIMGRLRSMSGLNQQPFLIGATNPRPDSWIKDFIQPHFVDEAGWPRWENSGRIMYYYIDSTDCIIKFWDKDEAIEYWKEANPYDYQRVLDGKRKILQPSSLTCIPSLLEHNTALEEKDPSYRQKLENMDYWEKMIFYYGNWEVAKANSDFFIPKHLQTMNSIKDLPENMTLVRATDLAYSKESILKGRKTNPDFTASVLAGKCKQTGMYYILDAKRMKGSLKEVMKFMRNNAIADAETYKQWGQVKHVFSQDAGAGKGITETVITAMDGFNISCSTESGTKEERFIPFCQQVNNENVTVLRGEWNRMWQNELSQFPQGMNDDLVDAQSKCHSELSGGASYDLLRCA